MQTALAQEQVTFERAADDFAASPGHSESITAMMRLALGGLSHDSRREASDWLMMNVNVKVTQDSVVRLSLVH
jgi:hypothetical protein